MKAKFFVLASVIALPGAVASMAMQGCSSDATEDTATPAGTDGGDAGKVTPTKDTSPPDEPEAGPAICPTTTPIGEGDLPLKWKPPPPIENDSCVQADIDKLKAAFKASTTGGVKYSQIKTELGTKCSDCVFSPLSDDGGLAANWSIFVEDMGGAIDNRTAACFTRFKDEACGKARYQFEACLRIGCKSADCDGDATKVKDCNGKVQSGACKALTDAYVAACPEEEDLIKACNLYGSIAASCSGGTDAGIDSSVP